MAKRDAKGRVVKGGGSLNPGGRPAIPAEVRETLRGALPKAAARLIQLINSDDERIALSACEAIMARVLGKVAGPMDDDEAGDQDRPLMGLTPAQLVEIVKAGGH